MQHLRSRALLQRSKAGGQGRAVVEEKPVEEPAKAEEKPAEPVKAEEVKAEPVKAAAPAAKLLQRSPPPKRPAAPPAKRPLPLKSK